MKLSPYYLIVTSLSFEHTKISLLHVLFLLLLNISAQNTNFLIAVFLKIKAILLAKAQLQKIVIK